MLAVEVFSPTEKDLAITFVDWYPAPPDKNMGLWGDAYVTVSGPLAVRHPHVITKLDLPSLDASGHRAGLVVIEIEAELAFEDPIHGLEPARLRPLAFNPLRH